VSLAWGSLILLILLLPGVLFFVGIYWPEQFTREVELRSPLGQLAGALLIAFSLHGFTYAVLGGSCGGWIPCPSVAELLRLVNADPAKPTGVAAAAAMLQRYRWWIFGYVITTSIVGGVGGAICGTLVVRRKIRGFTKHPWVYDLSVDELTYAYVMTNVAHAGRIVMYKGFLRAFALQQDGRFSYIVLTYATRFYMLLDEKYPVTSGVGEQRVIGQSSPAPAIAGPSEKSRHRQRVRSYFVIEGEDVANVVFDKLAVDTDAMETEAFKKLVREEARKLGLTLAEEDIGWVTKVAK
jgi:hypothetical protein